MASTLELLRAMNKVRGMARYGLDSFGKLGAFSDDEKRDFEKAIELLDGIAASIKHRNPEVVEEIERRRAKRAAALNRELDMRPWDEDIDYPSANPWDSMASDIPFNNIGDDDEPYVSGRAKPAASAVHSTFGPEDDDIPF